MLERGVYESQIEAPFSNPAAHLGSLFDPLQSYARRAVVNHPTDDNGLPQSDGLASAPDQHDPVVKHLRMAMLPVLEQPERACKLFLDHVTLALHAYCAHTYGGARTPSPTVRGGLAPWQLRRATDMLMAHLDGDISLRQVARECKLSVSHFARAFRQTTGQPPHRWLVCRRVDRAKDLLRQFNLPMVEIALRCGFADQASFIRAFKRVVGASPGGWRRACSA